MGTQKKHVQIYAEQVFGEFLSRVPQAEAEVNFIIAKIFCLSLSKAYPKTTLRLAYARSENTLSRIKICDYLQLLILHQIVDLFIDLSVYIIHHIYYQNSGNDD